jgi:hypothetical protein
MSHDDLINADEARKFLTLYHAQAGAAHAGIDLPVVLHLVSKAPDDRGMSVQAFNIGDVDHMLEAALINARAGRNVYVETRTVRPGRPSERGKIERTVGLFAFVIDRDGDTGKTGRALNGDASAVVETSPGNAHEWLFLRRALGAGDAKPLGELIRKGAGADHATGTITQPYRVPGTPNYPDAKKRERGRVTTATKLIAVTDRLWDPTEIEAAFSTGGKQIAKTQPNKKAAGALKQDAPTHDISAAVKRRVAAKVTSEMDRSAQFQSAVAAAVRAGMPPHDLEALMRKHPEGCAGKYLEGTDRLRPEIDRSWAKVEQGEDTAGSNEQPAPTPAPRCPPRTLAEVHRVFKKWFGAEYDLGILDAVLAVVAAEKLSGDPPWLLIISGPGNAKTETIQATSGLNTRVVSTITSEGALLSASPRKQRSKTATGGLLRQIGQRGVLAIKDFTSIISAGHEVRMQVLAALREVHDGHWVRNVGSDGGQSLEWQGRVVVIGACTTAWDQAHAVVATMGDRFVLVRANSNTGRMAAGIQAIRNTGTEPEMRRKLADAVAGLIGQVRLDAPSDLTNAERRRILQAADIVTLARTGVETDYRGNIIDAHAPEMPTRFAKQLTQIMRGGLAIGMSRTEAMALVIRCARNSMPPLRLAILEDIGAHPNSRVIDVRRRLQRPRATTDRALQALHILGLLVCDEEEEKREDGTRYIGHYTVTRGVKLAALSVPEKSVDNILKLNKGGTP